MLKIGVIISLTVIVVDDLCWYLYNNNKNNHAIITLKVLRYKIKIVFNFQ